MTKPAAAGMQTNRPHRGFMLIEVIATFALGVTLMMLAMGVVHQSMTFASLGKQRADRDRSLTRLDRQFRQDVHRASAFESPDAETLQLRMHDGSRIVYTINDAQIDRRRTSDNDPPHREQFVLNERSVVSLQVLTDPQRLAIIVGTDTQLYEAPLRIDRQIVAVPGLLLEYLSPGSSDADNAGEPSS